MMKLVVLSCVMAAASASNLFGGFVAPYAPLAYAAPFYQPNNYRGPFSLAPGQPASILGSDGRPLDTLEVNLDRAALFQRQAIESGVHLLKKRSAPVVAAPLVAPYAAPFVTPYTAPYVTPYAYYASLFQPSNYRGPLSLAPGQPADIIAADGRPLDTLDVNLDRAAHFSAKALRGVHILKKRSAAIIAPVAPIAAINHVALTRTPLIQPAFAYTAPIARYGHISYQTPFSHVY